MARLERVRSIVVGATVLALLVALPVALLTANPERRQLEELNRKLDAMLVQRRAMVENLERFRVEVANLEKRVEEVDRLLSPDLDSLWQAMRNQGIQVAIADPLIEGSLARLPFILRGHKAESVAGALASLQAAEYLLTVSKFEATREEWRLSGCAYDFDELRGGGAKAEPPPKSRREARWYASVNDDVRASVEEKRAQLRGFDKILGPVNGFTVLKKKLEFKLELVGRLSVETPDVRPAVRALFVAKPAPWSTLALAAKGSGIEGRGEPARGDLGRPALQALLPEGYRLTGLRRGRGAEVEFSVAPPEPAPVP